MRAVAAAFGVAMFMLLASASAAQSPDTSLQATAKAFGARPLVESIHLSPDGSHLALVVPTSGSGTALMIADLDRDEDPKIILTSDGQPRKIRRCIWATTARLVCQISMAFEEDGSIVYGTRSFAINQDGGDFKLISPQASGFMPDGGEIIGWRDRKRGVALQQRTALRSRGPNSGESVGVAVDEIDTQTGERRMVEPPAADVVEYLVDSTGAVRAKRVHHTDSDGFYLNKIVTYYRNKGDMKWREIGQEVEKYAGKDGEFHLYAFDHDKDALIGLDYADGQRKLIRINLGPELRRETLFGDGAVNVTGAGFLGDFPVLRWVSYVEGGVPKRKYFDDGLARIAAGITKSLGGQYELEFLETDSNESALLVLASSSEDPGVYYVYNRKTRQLGKVAEYRPMLSGRLLPRSRSVYYDTADGQRLPATLTLPSAGPAKGAPTVVLLSESDEEIDYMTQFLAARGFAVMTPSFKDGVTSSFGWISRFGFETWRTPAGEINDAARWLIRTGVAAPDKIAVAGKAYGGYLALQSAVVDPDLFKAIIAFSAITDLKFVRDDVSQYANKRTFFKMLGSGWRLEEGSPALYAQSFKAPVLLFHGEVDRVASVENSRRMAKALKAAGRDVEFVEFKGLDQDIVDSDARAQMLERTDRFLRRAMHMN